METNKAIINRVAIKNRVSSESVDAMVTQFYKSLKKSLSSTDLPNVVIHGFGRFKPRPSVTARLIKTDYYYLERASTETEFNTAYRKITNLCKAYIRLTHELREDTDPDIVDIINKLNILTFNNAQKQ